MVSVRVYGLKEFKAALLVTGRSLPDIVDDAAREAAEVVAKSARAGFPLGPGRGGHARSSIEAVHKGDAWSVQGGGAQFPYYAWIDFGGSINKHTSKPTRRPFFKKGRFIYPAYERNRPRVYRAMTEALRRHAESAGIEVD